MHKFNNTQLGQLVVQPLPMHVCVCACVRACVRACVHACMHACVCDLCILYSVYCTFVLSILHSTIVVCWTLDCGLLLGYIHTIGSLRSWSACVVHCAASAQHHLPHSRLTTLLTYHTPDLPHSRPTTLPTYHTLLTYHTPNLPHSWPTSHLTHHNPYIPTTHLASLLPTLTLPYHTRIKYTCSLNAMEAADVILYLTRKRCMFRPIYFALIRAEYLM